MGNTVSDIDVSKAVVFSKTKFSMVVPEVVEILEKSPERQNVVLFGIEVSSICFTFDCIKNDIFFYLPSTLVHYFLLFASLFFSLSLSLSLSLSFYLLFQTQVCVQQTCLNLLGRGMNVHILADGCSSRSQVDRLFAFEVIMHTCLFLLLVLPVSQMATEEYIVNFIFKMNCIC